MESFLFGECLAPRPHEDTSVPAAGPVIYAPMLDHQAFQRPESINDRVLMMLGVLSFWPLVTDQILVVKVWVGILLLCLLCLRYRAQAPGIPHSPALTKPLAELVTLEENVRTAGPKGLSAKQKRMLQELSEYALTVQQFKLHRALGWGDDVWLIRFLRVASWDLPRARDLLNRALQWRSMRMPYWVLDSPGEVADAFREECRTGKAWLAGVDRWQRGLIILNNSVQNSLDPVMEMRHFAFLVEAALRSSALNGQSNKICIIANLENFTWQNQPAPWQVLEAIEMLTVAYPDALGNFICWLPSSIFAHAIEPFRYLVDDTVWQKTHFIVGSTADGSENDRIMKELVGIHWRQLTGITDTFTDVQYSAKEKKSIRCARGFHFEGYWADLLKREKAWARVHPRVRKPPSLMQDIWDGGFRRYWNNEE